MAARAAIYEDEDDDPLLSPSTPVHHTQKRSFFCEVVGEEVLSLLQWSMLAACTIGPGTVVVCAKSGADFQLQLLWTLVMASIVAFILQKEAACLTMQTGMSFGRAIRERFGEPGSDSVPRVGWAMSIAVFVSNTALEANCFAGAEAGLFVLYEDAPWFRVLMSVVMGGLTLLALLFADVDKLGQILGVLVMGMTIIFATTAAKVPPIYEAYTGSGAGDGNASDAGNATDANGGEGPRDFRHDFGMGLIPNIPSGAAVTALSMVATTAIPFNTFLAASMTEMAKSPGQMKRGVAFATALAMVISMLVVVIGSGITIEPGQDFEIQDLGKLIGDTLGQGAKVLFCVGLYAAAYSSAITCPLGSALTAQQIFHEGRLGSSIAHQHDFNLTPGGNDGIKWVERWATKGVLFRANMVVGVVVAVLTSSAGLPTVAVIFVAQIIGGLLLPCVSMCLFICLNDPVIVTTAPTALGNVPMMFCVFVTTFLACHLVLDELSAMIGGHQGDSGDRAWDGGASISISGAFSTVASAVLVICTIPECRQLFGLPPRRRSQRTAAAANAVYDPPHTRAVRASGRPAMPASVELSEIGTG